MYHAQGSYYSPKRVVKDEKVRVAINNSSFCVGNRVYPFDIISRVCMARVTPNRKPGLLMIAVGASLAFFAFFNSSYIAAIKILDKSFPQVEVLGSTGVLLCIAGLLALLMATERYAARIIMGPEQMDAVVSRKKNYVRRIVVALTKEIKKTQARAKREVA